MDGLQYWGGGVVSEEIVVVVVVVVVVAYVFGEKLVLVSFLFLLVCLTQGLSMDLCESSWHDDF